MDRRTLLAIFLSFAIFLGWQKFYIEPRMQQQVQTAPAPSTATSGPTSPSLALGTQTPAPETQTQAMAPKSPGPKRPAKSVELSTQTGVATLTDSGPLLNDWRLTRYRKTLSGSSEAVDLQSVTHRADQLQFAFDDPAYAYLNTVQGEFEKTSDGSRWVHEDENVRVVREARTTPSLPYFELSVNAEFKAKRPKFAFLSLASGSVADDQEQQDRQLVYWTNNSIERVHLKDVTALQDVATPVQYIAATTRYFLFALVDQTPGGLARAQIQPLTGAGRISLVYPVNENKISLHTRVYFGPKQLDLLRQVHPALDNTVDLGWFTIFAYPLLSLLKWFYQFVHNYGVSIILLTLLLKIVTYPLTYKSMKSMKEMARIQPQLQRVREKYKDDREALNREMLTLMRTHGYNPMSGCLPMLIQMPIFFALYRVLYSSIELYQAPFAFWIHDLSARDPLYITPVLLSLTMFIQQKLTPSTATDPMQAKMMQMMPLIFGAFMLTLPSGLTLYMLVNAVASIVQQIILNKKLDIGNVSQVAAKAR